MQQGGPQRPQVQVLQDVPDAHLHFLDHVKLLKTRQLLHRCPLDRAEEHQEVPPLQRHDGGLLQPLLQHLALFFMAHLTQPPLTARASKAARTSLIGVGVACTWICIPAIPLPPTVMSFCRLSWATFSRSFSMLKRTLRLRSLRLVLSWCSTTVGRLVVHDTVHNGRN